MEVGFRHGLIGEKAGVRVQPTESVLRRHTLKALSFGGLPANEPLQLVFVFATAAATAVGAAASSTAVSTSSLFHTGALPVVQYSCCWPIYYLIIELSRERTAERQGGDSGNGASKRRGRREGFRNS